jgi:hypothetical protein
MFAASVNPASGQTDFRYLSIGDESKNVAPEVWTFVPTPQVMRVPQMR